MNELQYDNKVLIVGKQFAAFANHKDIFHFDQCEEFFNELTKNPKKYLLYLGQGLSDPQIKYLRNKMSSNNEWIKKHGKMYMIQRAPGFYTNSHPIISDPQKMNEETYQSYLMINDSTENSDNISQITSMSLIKAAHQFLEIVSKKYFLTQQVSKEKTFIFNPIQAHVYAEIYPIDLTLELKIETYRPGLDFNFKAIGVIDFIQNEKIVASTTIEFGLLQKDILLNIQQKSLLAELDNAHQSNEISPTSQFAA